MIWVRKVRGEMMEREEIMTMREREERPMMHERGTEDRPLT